MELRSIAARVGLPSRRQTSNVGGSTATLHTDEHVIPHGCPSRSGVVTMATPLGNVDIRERNCAEVTAVTVLERPAAPPSNLESAMVT
ncbi:hypothetical protein GCM10010442_61490 [Kitasatospora kifunensis]